MGEVIMVDFRLRAQKVEKAARQIIDTEFLRYNIDSTEAGNRIYESGFDKAVKNLSDRERHEVERVLELQQSIHEVS